MKKHSHSKKSLQDTPEELTLDPADWVAFRAFAHQALDHAVDYIEGGDCILNKADG